MNTQLKKLLPTAALAILAPITLAQAPPVPDSPQAQPMQATAQHPALFLVGDSIMRTGTGNGDTGPWGWGYGDHPACSTPPRSTSTTMHSAAAAAAATSRKALGKRSWISCSPATGSSCNSATTTQPTPQNYPDRTTLKGDGDETKRSSRPSPTSTKPSTPTAGTCANM